MQGRTKELLVEDWERIADTDKMYLQASQYEEEEKFYSEEKRLKAEKAKAQKEKRRKRSSEYQRSKREGRIKVKEESPAFVYPEGQFIDSYKLPF